MEKTGRGAWLLGASIFAGCVWHGLVTALGCEVVSRSAWLGLLSGAAAGVAAGQFTVWSLQRSRGRDSVLQAVATYYLAIVVYWISGGVIEDVRGLVRDGHLAIGVIGHVLSFPWVLGYGTVLGLVLLPLCWITRDLLWAAYGGDGACWNGAAAKLVDGAAPASGKETMNESSVRTILRLIAVVVVLVGLCWATTCCLLILWMPGSRETMLWIGPLIAPLVVAAWGSMLYRISGRLARRILDGTHAGK